MLRNLLNLLALAGFFLLLSFFGASAYFWGSPDERWLMKIAFCALSPLCAAMWFVVLSRIFLRKRPLLLSWLIQICIIIIGYRGVALLIKSGPVTFGR
jgi:hypothetical protein